MDTKRNTFTDSTAVGSRSANLSPTPPKQIFYFQSDVNLDAVAAAVGATVVLSGTTSCEQLKDILSDQGNETEIFVRNANENITTVQVSVGGAPSVAATPTGPGDTPWTSWTATVSGLPDGPTTISVEAFPSRNPATAARSTVVDLTPPGLSIVQPADVVRPAPPFIATITGTAVDNASGVAAVEWQFGDGAIATASGTTSWSADVPLPGLGLHTVSFRARDNIGNVGPMQNVTVRVGDITPPSLAIAVPEDGETRPLVEGQATFELRGTASDTQSGVALVEWSLDGTTFTAATAQVADWSIWSAPVRDHGRWQPHDHRAGHRPGHTRQCHHAAARRRRRRALPAAGPRRGVQPGGVPRRPARLRDPPRQGVGRRSLHHPAAAGRHLPATVRRAGDP